MNQETDTLTHSNCPSAATCGSVIATPKTDAVLQTYSKARAIMLEKLAKQLEAELSQVKALKRELAKSLDCIADYGGQTVETECGEMSCNGAWCAEQARTALSQNAELSDSRPL